MTKRQKLLGKTLNSCAIFVLPMVGINYKKKNIIPKNFTNAYIANDYKVIMTFGKNFDDGGMLEQFVDNCRSGKELIDVEISDDEVILTFDIPTQLRRNFDLFKKGKYSKFTEAYKTRIVQFYGKETVKDNHEVTEYNVIYPQEFKRKQIAEELGVDANLIDEVFSAPDLEIEIYKRIEQLEKKTRKEYDERQRDIIPDNSI